MRRMQYYLTYTATYNLLRLFRRQFYDFIETIGNMGLRFVVVLKFLLSGQISWKNLIEQSARFGFDSLPITIAIVSMTTIILTVQVAPEMVKQGGANFVGALISLVTVREMGVIMSGFAIISMIGSSMASEIATMKVTDQISALKVLKVSPIKYLFVPRILAGALMMPVVCVIASTVGIICGGYISALTCPEISGLNYITSVKLGLFNRDIGIMLLKASADGAAIAHISSSCGLDAAGGAKSVGDATCKSVVWSFIAIVVIDYLFALAFYF